MCQSYPQQKHKMKLSSERLKKTVLLLNVAFFILHVCCNKNIASQPINGIFPSALPLKQSSHASYSRCIFTYYLTNTALKAHETRGFLRICLLDTTPD